VERLEAAAAEIRERGGFALPIPIDVAPADQVEAAAERIERELAPIDVSVEQRKTLLLTGRCIRNGKHIQKTASVYAPVGARS
jgi:hypothetical protein